MLFEGQAPRDLLELRSLWRQFIFRKSAERMLTFYQQSLLFSYVEMPYKLDFNLIVGYLKSTVYCTFFIHYRNY